MSSSTLDSDGEKGDYDMSNKVKNIVTTVLFSAFVAFFSVMCVIKCFNPTDYFTVEKRPAAQLPSDFTWQEFLENEDVTNENGDVVKSPIHQFEDFTVDQFPLRDSFRSLKAFAFMDVLRKNDNNGYIDLSEMSAGIYFLEIRNNDKLVIEKIILTK